MMQEEYNDKGVNYVRIDKRKARIKFNEGKTIYLIPDMMRLDNAWQSLCPINNKRTFDGEGFDKLINSFQYYNCDSERGKGIKYFIKKEGL